MVQSKKSSTFARENNATWHSRIKVILCEHMKEMLIVIGMLACAMLLLCVRVILKNNGRFSSQHISGNKRMKQDGIHCATSQDREARRANAIKINPKEL